MPRAVILTALPVEYWAVRAHLTDLREETHPQGTVYERGKFAGNGQVWEVGIAEVGAGNAGAAIEAERAIAHFKPDILFFVGIAGGIKDVAIGDVVAATKVYGYESGKVGEQFFTRPALGQSAHALVQRAKAEARKGEWLRRLSSSPASQPCVFVAPIAAGEKVIASKESDVFNFVRASYNDAIAVEMEGFGFLGAAFAHPNIKAIVIRGISDLIQDKNADGPVEGTEDEQQERAAHNASAFAFEVLSRSEANNDQNPIPQNEVIIRKKYDYSDLKVKANFSNLYKSLLSKDWKTADQETARLLLKYVDKRQQDCLGVKDIQKISGQELRYISDLWSDYSNGQFGFKVQMELWSDIGGQLNHETEIYLGKCLGWYRDGKWKNHSELNFSLEGSPEGHLPGFFLSSWCWRNDLFILRFLQKFSEYIKR